MICPARADAFRQHDAPQRTGKESAPAAGIFLFFTDKATKRIRLREKTEERKVGYYHMKKNISYKKYEIMWKTIYSIRKIISIKNY